MSTPNTGNLPETQVRGTQDETFIGSTNESRSLGDVVGFQTKGIVEEASYVKADVIDDILDDLTIDKPHNIQSFLARPIKLGVYNFSSTNTPGQIIQNFDISTLLVTDAKFRLVRDKLQGFYGWSFNTNLRIVMNAQPFESGILGVSYGPFYDPEVYLPLSSTAITTNLRLPFLTGLPHQLLNLASQSEITLTVPYVGPEVFLNLQTLPSFGTFFIYPVVPAASAVSPTNIPFSVYMYFTDVKFYGATVNNFAAVYSAESYIDDEVDDYSDTDSEISEESMSEGEILEALFSDDDEDWEHPEWSGNWYIDMRRLGKRNYYYAEGPELHVKAPEQCSESNGAGPITSNLRAIAAIPILKDTAPEVSFAMHAASNITDRFGLSRPPINDVKTVSIHAKPYGLTANDDVNTNIQKLSLSASQNIQINSFGPTEEDEMSIAKIVKDPQYYVTFNWPKSAGVGDLLFQTPVNPNCLLNNGGAAVGRIYAQNRLSFISQFFTYWRGAIRYYMHFASTKFHSGRLRFTYQVDSPIDSGIDNAAFFYSEIVDIRDAQIVSLECPYICTSPWRIVPNDNGTTNSWLTVNTNDFGLPYENFLRVYVETPLRSPDNVTDIVSVAVMNSAGEDFQLTAPETSNFMTLTSSESWFSAVAAETVFQAEGPRIEGSMADTVPTNICGGKISTLQYGLDAFRFANGESVRSVRSLLKRYQLIVDSTLAGTTLIGPRLILPYWLPPVGPGNGGPMDWFANIVPLYRFYSGGIRYHFTDGGRTTEASNLTVGYGPASATNYIPDINKLNSFAKSLNAASLGLAIDNRSNAATSPWSPIGRFGYYNATNVFVGANSQTVKKEMPRSATVLNSDSWTTEIEVPYYTRWPLMVRRVDANDLKLGQDYVDGVNSGSYPNGAIVITSNKSISGQFYLMRAIADDFSLSFMLGAPLTQYQVTRSL